VWEAMVSAAQHLFSPGPLIAIALIVPIALLNGLLVSGGIPVYVLLLGLITHLDLWIAIPIAIAYAAANDATEPIPSILLGVPGSKSSQATIIDGHAMARQGRAGEALGAAYISSMIGGWIGGFTLLLAIPIAREILEFFGSAEFFLLSMLGIATVGILSSGAMVKGLLTAFFGLTISLVGFSPITTDVRATLGIAYLWDGFPLIPALMGLFAFPEMASLVMFNTTVATARLDRLLIESQKDVWKGIREALRHKFLIFRSSIIGTFVGMMPGLGATPAHWIAYAHACQTERGARKSFGTGDIRGVIAPEAANNAIDGGVLIPTLIFSIPGSAPMAIFLSFLILKGVQPGPAMLTEHLDLIIALAWIIILANLVVVPIVLWFAPLLVRLTLFPPNILAPLVMGLVLIGVFQNAQSLGDLVVFAAFGVLGLFMKAYGWPRPPIIVAIVLSEIIEKYLWISVQAYGVSMLARPQFLGILFVVVAVLAIGYRTQRRGLEDGGPNDQPVVLENDFGNRTWQRRIITIEMVGELVLLTAVAATFAYFAWESRRWGAGTALLPRIAIALGTPFWVARVITLIRGERSRSKSRIMDIGFFEANAESPRDVAVRLISFNCWVVGMMVGIWLLGFHVTIPLGVAFYLRRYAGTGWSGTLMAAAIYEALLIGLYDTIVGLQWNEPLIFQILGIQLPWIS